MKFPGTGCQLIGAGRAGRALSQAMKKAGYSFTWIGSKKAADAEKLALKLDAGAYGAGFNGFSHYAGFLILAVPDGEIAHAASVAAALGIIEKGVTIAAHLSGALGSDVLGEMRAAGASVMAFHPAQSFTLESDPYSVFRGICFDMEGDDAACALGECIAKDLGAVSVKLKPEQRILSHIAMTVASNYTVSLMHMAEEIMIEAGISHDVAVKMLNPLFTNTARNITGSGTLNALTGPVSRGDIPVIARHLDKLSSMGHDYQTAYKSLARIALRMAVERGDVIEAKAEEIGKILGKDEG